MIRLFALRSELFQLFFVLFRADFPMDDERKQGTDQNDDSQDGQFLQVVDDYGFDDLSAHLEFQRKGERFAKVHHHVERLLGPHTLQQTH